MNKAPNCRFLQGNLIRHIRKDERKYYEDLLEYSRNHLMLYPYHLSGKKSFFFISWSSWTNFRVKFTKMNHNISSIIKYAF